MIKIRLILLLSLVVNSSFGQLDTYDFKRKINGVKDEWHRFEIPDNVFGKLHPSLHDLRIYGVTADKDTVEAPYIMRVQEKEITTIEIAYELLNVAKNNNGYYYTFKIPEGKRVNEIDLDFNRNNFDWEITLEGSQDQLTWYKVLENYRILAINNEYLKYNYTHLTFPKTEYRYFRLFIPTKVNPNLITPTIRMRSVLKGNNRNFKIISQKITEDKSLKETIIEVSLKEPVPISSIRVNCSNTFDFYRSVSFEYLSDSVKTEKGYLKNYVGFKSGVLSSLEQNDFDVSTVIVKNLRIHIFNGDNQPLDISGVEVRGHVHEVIARFTEDADYFFSYGNSKAYRPNYDINHFRNKIPKELTDLTLGEELLIHGTNSKKEANDNTDGGINKIWLWVIMTVIIIVLGWFTFKMMRSESQSKES